MTDKEYMKQVVIWCDYFVNCPYSKLYLLGKYDDYKKFIEDFNYFIFNDKDKLHLDSEDVFNAKVNLLNNLIKDGYLQINEEEK